MKRLLASGLIFCISIFLLISYGVAYEGPITEEVMPKGEATEEKKAEDEIIKAKRESNEAARKVIVAKVNDVPITMYQVIKMMNAIGPQIGGDIETIKKEAINRVITQELAHQKAKAMGVTVDIQNVENALENIIENLGGEEGFKKFLEGEAMTEDEYRKDLERLFAVEVVFNKDVVEKAIVPGDKIREEYEKLKDRLIFPEKVGVIDVYFTKTDKTTQKKAQQILKKIKADKDKDPWKLVLDGTFIVRAIELQKDRHKELYEAAKKLKVGQLSNVIKTPTSLHIIKLMEYSPEKPATLEEVRGYLESRLKPFEIEKRFKEWSEELRKDAKIEMLEK